jgi:hypothetical protein
MFPSIYRLLLAAVLVSTLVAAGTRDPIARRALEQKVDLARSVTPSRTLRQVTSADLVRRSRARANLKGAQTEAQKRHDSTPSNTPFPSCGGGVTATGYAHFKDT